MVTIKDQVASHISTNWGVAVVCGSGAKPNIDAVGPEDIENPRDEKEAVLVYNERKIPLRRYNQNLLEDRVYAVPVTIRLDAITENDKTIMDNCRTELERIFGVQVTGFDAGQYWDGPVNLTMGKGIYEARYMLYLPQYGQSVSSAWTGTGVTSGYQDIIPATDSTYDLGSTTKYWKAAYIDAITTTGNVTVGGDLSVTGSMNILDADVPDTITLTDITQITNRSHTDLSDIGTNTHAQIDTHIADASDPHGSTLTQSVAVDTPLIQSSGAIALKPSGDTDDYIEWSTITNIPKMKMIGGSALFFESNDAAWVFFDVLDTTSNYFQIAIHKTQDYGRIFCTGEIRILPNNDSDDYWYFKTTTNAPSILSTAGAAAGTIGDASNYADEVHASSGGFVEHSHGHLDKPALSDLGKIKQNADGKYDWKTLPDYLLHEEDEYKIEDGDMGVDEMGKPVKEKRKKPTGKKAHGIRIGALASVLVKAIRELEARLEALEAK